METERTAARRITVAWLAACVLTVVSALVATVTDSAEHRASTLVSVLVLGLGAAKAWLILDEFMEIRTAPTWLRLAARGWLAVLVAGIVVLYLQ
jgi:heme/copper-type cytochrome/quinol oxidase subunit 4